MPKKKVRPAEICPASLCGLDAPKFGLVLGIMCALWMLIIGLAATYAGYGTEIVKVLGSIYIGYDLTLIGAIVGAIWGFVDGLIGGFLFAWIYNKII